MGYDGRRLARGFTLVEFLVVVAIIGIMAGMAVWNYRIYMDRYKVEDETKKMYADMMTARARAAQRNRMAFVVFANAGAGTRMTTYEDTSPVPDGNRTLETASDTKISDDTSIHRKDTTNIGANEFFFDRDGLASVTGFVRVITTISKPDYDCINISPTRLRMGRFNGATCVSN